MFPPMELFEALGGREAVARIADGLYDRIETDTLLRSAFPRELIQEREKLTCFMEAWFGAEPAYFDRTWPPSLTAAHGAISISPDMARRWVAHFLDACTDVVTNPDTVEQIRPFVVRLATALVNRQGEPRCGERLRCNASDPRFARCIQCDDATGLAQLAQSDPRVVSHHGPRLLLLAALGGKARATKALLEQGVDPNTTAILPGAEAKTHNLPTLQITPLCVALAKRHGRVVDVLVERGAQYDVFSASCIGDLEAVRAFLELDPRLADAHDPACDVGRITPLTHAVFAGQTDVARLLLQSGATVGVHSVRLVRAAANRGDVALIELLLERGGKAVGIGAGPWALYPEIADKLVTLGANVNEEPGAWIGVCCTGNSGHKQNVALARALLHYGADVAAQYKGRGALHCAAKAGFAEIVGAIIEHGGDVNALSDRGETPLGELEHAAKSIDPEPVRRILMAHHARPSKSEGLR